MSHVDVHQVEGLVGLEGFRWEYSIRGEGDDGGGGSYYLPESETLWFGADFWGLRNWGEGRGGGERFDEKDFHVRSIVAVALVGGGMQQWEGSTVVWHALREWRRTMEWDMKELWRKDKGSRRDVL